MFTLGSITCPACGAGLALESFTASVDHLEGVGRLRCRSCLCSVNATIRLAVVDPLLCPDDDCLRIFDSPQALANHRRREHSNASPPRLAEKVVCRKGCGSSFHPKSLSRHERSCPGSPSVPVPELVPPAVDPTPPPAPPPSGRAARQAAELRPLTGTARSRLPREVPASATVPPSRPGEGDISGPAPAAPPDLMADLTASIDSARAERAGSVCEAIDEDGPCGETRITSPGEWRRVRVGGRLVSLCPDHADDPNSAPRT